jgi:hypothetical protein
VVGMKKKRALVMRNPATGAVISGEATNSNFARGDRFRHLNFEGQWYLLSGDPLPKRGDNPITWESVRPKVKIPKEFGITEF